MTHHETPRPIKAPFLTTGTRILLLLTGIGAAFYLYRLIFGIGAATNLDNQYPWGIWISIDVASGVALAAGGFTTAALAEIFHKEEYHVIVRPALLTAMLGYTFVVIGLLADLGRYYNVWHPMLPSMWQGNSVLFEVGMCVMIYLTVLYIEFLPIAVERFKGKVNWLKPLRWANRPTEWALRVADATLSRFIFVFIIAGVVLSCLHQSSLGTLMVIAKGKMHPLWWSPISPLMFLLSAIAVGFPMVMVESISASRSFKLHPERTVLSSLARYTPILLGVYLGVKIIDLTLRGAWPYAFEGSARSFMWWIEILGGVVTPLIMTSIPKVRQNMNHLFIAALMVVLGVVLNRVNVLLVAYQPLYPTKIYFPSFMEIGVTIGLASALILVYRWVVMNFPVITAAAEMRLVRRPEEVPTPAHIAVPYRRGEEFQ
jgi:Ni/Fe-hydrogenase subunit HybB-like protein